MIEHAPGPVPAWLGRVLAPLYGRAIAHRNQRYDAGVGVVRLPLPVLSIGNISVGGTGKTPMVMHALSTLLEAGQGRIRPCIAMRGYARRKDRQPDEVDSYRRMFPDVPIIAQPDRVAGVQRLLAAGTPITCVVLDDGFQHRRIARDLDIVLIDATRPPERDRLLPAGWLREPINALRRASAVVVTHTEHVDHRSLESTIAAIGRHHGRPPLAISRHLWTGLLCHEHGVERALALDSLLGRRVFGCCAIGNPDAFVRSLRLTVESSSGTSGGAVVGSLVLPDHDPFSPATVDGLINRLKETRAQALVVTDKDWSKLRFVASERWPCPVVRPVLALSFDSGRDELDRRIVAAARGQS